MTICRRRHARCRYRSLLDDAVVRLELRDLQRRVIALDITTAMNMTCGSVTGLRSMIPVKSVPNPLRANVSAACPSAGDIQRDDDRRRVGLSKLSRDCADLDAFRVKAALMCSP